MNFLSLKGKVAIITGGNSGLGQGFKILCKNTCGILKYNL